MTLAVLLITPFETLSTKFCRTVSAPTFRHHLLNYLSESNTLAALRWILFPSALVKRYLSCNLMNMYMMNGYDGRLVVVN